MRIDISQHLDTISQSESEEGVLLQLSDSIFALLFIHLVPESGNDSHVRGPWSAQFSEIADPCTFVYTRI